MFNKDPLWEEFYKEIQRPSPDVPKIPYGNCCGWWLANFMLLLRSNLIIHLEYSGHMMRFDYCPTCGKQINGTTHPDKDNT